MSRAEWCRLCANLANAQYARSLFEQDQQKLLRQVEELIGKQLQNSKDLPQHICISCQAHTMQAHEFRERCIRAQQHFTTEQYHIRAKKQAASNNYNKVELLTKPDINDDDECHFNDKCDFQADGDEDDYQPNTDADGDEDADGSKESSDDDKPLRSRNNLPAGSSKTVKGKNDRDFPCAQCGTVLKSRPSLKVHMKRHNGDKPFVCDQCPKRFCSKQECTRHRTTHTGERPFPCQQCDRRFINNAGLSQHVRTWHNQSKSSNEIENKPSDTPKICDLCGKYFKNSSSFHNHMIRHSGIRRFQCKHCPKAYFLNSQLTIHMYTHTGEKPFVCKICGRAFNDRSPLIVHYRRHKNERPFVCTHCGKSFFTSVVLNSHMVTHSGAREFECNVCNMSFKLKKTLMVHYGTKGHKNKEANQK